MKIMIVLMCKMFLCQVEWGWYVFELLFGEDVFKLDLNLLGDDAVALGGVNVIFTIMCLDV
ncbi:hypothetical protein, partial [Bacillus subtilis]|uniref:hypothetical protein n=1 Tax=Bacillus subtilis TaxID=1423 RepID=UPI0011A52016